VDLTPTTTSEYIAGGLVFGEAQERGENGWFIETSRRTGRTSAFPMNLLDMYGTAMHEMGHALGMYDASGSRFRSESGTDHDIDVNFYGSPWTSSWKVKTIGHFSDTNMQLALMGHFGDLGWGERLFPTQADILSIGQLNRWNIHSWGPSFFDYWNPR